MRIAALSLVGAVWLAASAIAANAAPAVPSPASQPEANIVQVAGGCGWGFHPNRWHRCVQNHRYGYYRPRAYWRGYYGGGYGRGYYGAGYYGGGIMAGGIMDRARRAATRRTTEPARAVQRQKLTPVAP